MMIILAVLVLGVLVFVHEFGHFIVAKAHGIAVVEFSIGFGRKLVRRRIGETIYSIGAIPLGGYVRMAGDDPREIEKQAQGAKADTERAAQEAAGEAAAKPDADTDPEELYLRMMLSGDPSRWFLNKGFLAKSAVVIAGPAFNLLFAFLLSALAFYSFGKMEAGERPLIHGVMESYPAAKAGMKPGDEVLSVDGDAVDSWREFSDLVAGSGGRELTIRVRRPSASAGSGDGSSEVEIKVTGKPDVDELASLEAGEQKLVYRIGVKPEPRRVSFGLGTSLILAGENVYQLSRLMIRGLIGMIQGNVSTKNLGGPIFIFKEAADSAKAGLEHLFQFMIFLSVSLAILNLLPIPILDGGHLVFFLIEFLKGGPVSLKIQEYANQVGMLILLLLMVFAMGNDIAKLFDASL